MFGPDAALPHRPARIVVAGTSGSGKTTLAARIGALLDIEHVEIDSLFHGPNWTPRATFESDVEEFIARPSWVTEWQYSLVRDRLADRAELFLWLDLPRRTVMWQVIVRTLRRRFGRTVLWNGNIEPPLHRIFFDRDHIVRWAWNTYRSTTERVERLSVRCPELTIVRFHSHRDVDAWIAHQLIPQAR
ncbi:AAA family ATPase [Rhodococcus sp. 06-462-5]|uniref:AAA family ATPase n=1 Tax=unclassified Rhodococcus (in: high G+C Gram-positive bacteria) TaxID=192944 RepID=UPI000B9ABAB6|nr:MULTISPECIES: AAA family ATPase [unclassified Rhodococcus (in: high G+C Gram-positive bacteria)]OZC78622.1 AAA family ATPase [Rhodococcus sp. 06-462-5]OZE63676.1 AAA family ATPase [Rhodococcus sp. 02-925g]